VRYPRLVMFAAVVIVVTALYLAQAVLMPFALAVFLCFVLSPLARRLEHWRLGRVPSVLIVALFTFAAIASVGWIVGHQAMNIVTRLPEFRENLESKLALVRETIHGPLQRASDAVQQIERGASADAGADGGHAPAAANWATVSSRTLRSWFGMSGVVVLRVIIMLMQRGDVRDRFIALAGGGVGAVTTQALDEAAQRVSRFLLVLTIINAA
jgi:predicted PurR-regulated permease PerM